MQNKLKIALSLLALTVSLAINATIISGSCGDNATYRLEDDGTLHIEGSGDMWCYAPGATPLPAWCQHNKKIQNVQVEEGITSIGDYSFYYCFSLASVSIPNSVTSIGNYAFSECYSLPSISIPNSVTSIGEGAFYKCSSLVSISIPNSIISIGDRAFHSCM